MTQDEVWAVIAEHQTEHENEPRLCRACIGLEDWPCLPYRLAAALAAERNRTTGAAEAQQTPGGAEKSQEVTTTDDR